MIISKLIIELQRLKDEHGDIPVHAFPGWDTSYPISLETIDYYPPEIAQNATGYILLVGDAEGAQEDAAKELTLPLNGDYVGVTGGITVSAEDVLVPVGAVPLPASTPIVIFPALPEDRDYWGIYGGAMVDGEKGAGSLGPFAMYPSESRILEGEVFSDLIDFAPVRAYFAAHPCRSSAYAPKLNAFVFLTDCSLLIWMLNAKAWSAPIEVPEGALEVRQVGDDVYVLAPNSLSVLAEDGVSWVVNVLTEGRDFKECPSVDQSKCFECQMKHAAANTVKGIFCSAKCEDRYIARGSVFFGNEPSVITSRGPQPDTVILDDIDAGGDPDTVRQTLVNVIAAPIVAKITKAEIAFKCPDCFTTNTVDAAYLARLKASENFNSPAKMRVPGCGCQVTIKRVAEAIEKGTQ